MECLTMRQSIYFLIYTRKRSKLLTRDTQRPPITSIKELWLSHVLFSAFSFAVCRRFAFLAALSPDRKLNFTVETRRILTVPHTLSLPDQATLAEQLQQKGVDIIQTKDGNFSYPSKSGVLSLIEKGI
ncbi:hypothetical protein L1887_31470 [Cichorium endivia]|nr:hypothetical protein L1887_31470 [Cichorium endivia]